MKKTEIHNSILKSAISLLFISCAASGLIACGKASPGESNDKKTSEGGSRDRIFGGYWLTYTAENDSLRTFAQFRKGGSKGEPQKLPKDATVKINGKTMQLQVGDKEYTSMSGENYEFSEKVSSALNSEYVYEVKNSDGTNSINKVKMASPLEVSIGMNEDKNVSKNGGLQVSFVGNPNSENESIVCSLVSLEKEALVKLGGELTEKLNKVDSCVFSPEELSSLPLGKANLKMIRSWKVENANGHKEAGGFLLSDYVSKPVIVNITE